MTFVYLAGPYSSRDLLAGYRAELTRVGYQVRARWLDGARDLTTIGPDSTPPDASSEDKAGWAHEDLEDIRVCDVLIAFTSAAVGGGGASGGRHIETGYALGEHKTVLLVGEPENVFHWLPGITRVPDWHEALIELSARLVASHRDMPRVEATR